MFFNGGRPAHHCGRSEQLGPRTTGIGSIPGLRCGLSTEVYTRFQGGASCRICAATLTAITSGSLPVMPGRPIGQVTCASSRSREAALLQPVPEGRPLGLAADQADVGQVAALAQAPQAGGHDVQVLRVAEAHDQHARARRQLRHRRLHRIGVLAHDVGRQPAAGRSRRGCRSRSRRRAAAPARSTSALPTWPPPNSASGASARRQPLLQRRRHRRRRRARSAGAPRRRSTGPGWGPGRSGAPARPPLPARRRRASSIAWNSRWPPPMVPSHVAGENRHPGARLARRGALRRLDGYQHARLRAVNLGVTTFMISQGDLRHPIERIVAD